MRKGVGFVGGGRRCWECRLRIILCGVTICEACGIGVGVSGGRRLR